jgi:hypothetical protein
MQSLVNVVPLLLNTAHPSASKYPDYSSYYLVDEGEKQDVGGGVVKWTQTYSVVPASWDDPESYVYTYPGWTYFAATGGYSNWGRVPLTERVPSRIRNDYFLVNPALGSDAPPVYKSAFNIPTNFAFLATAQFVVGGTTYGGANYKQENVSDGEVFVPTTPTRAQYFAMIIDANTNAWNAAITSQPVTGSPILLIDVAHAVYGGQIIAETSQITRWKGNIWCRKTRYVLAL